MSLDAINNFTKSSINEKFIHPEKMKAPLISIEQLKEYYSKVDIPEVKEDLKKIEDLVVKSKLVKCGSCENVVNLDECAMAPTGLCHYCNVCQKDPQYEGKTIENLEEYEIHKKFMKNRRSASFDCNLTDEEAKVTCNNPNCDCRD